MILNEKRTILKGDDALALLNNGKLAGRLGGKKFIPVWLSTEPDTFKKVVDATLHLIGNGVDLAGDETIQYLISCSKNGPEKWFNIIENNPDVIRALSSAFATKWIESSEWLNRLKELSVKEYDYSDWHSLEKDILETLSKRKAKKGKKIQDTNPLYETLYEDSEWGLYVPKSFEGDVELASHLSPDDEGQTKTHWCTAAQESYFERYTRNGRLKLYVVKKYFNGVATKAWQMSFIDDDHIEFMDRMDDEEGVNTIKRWPKEIQEKIIDDNEDQSMYFRENLSTLVKILESQDTLDVDGLFELGLADAVEYLQHLDLIDNCYIQDDTSMIGIKDPSEPTVINVPAKVTAIRMGKEYPAKNVVGINFPEGLEFIEDESFQEYDDLEEITIPSSIKHVGNAAFAYCGKLKKVTIMPNTGEWEEKTFAYCQNLQSAEILGMKELSEGMFLFCNRLTNITLPKELYKIGTSALEGTGIKDIQLPSGLKEIWLSAFEDTDLIKVELPKSLEILQTGAFCKCENLTEVTVQGPISKLGAEVFLKDKKLAKVNGLSYILNNPKYDQDTFKNCPKLIIDPLSAGIITKNWVRAQLKKDPETLIMPESVTRIERDAFQNIVAKKVIFNKDVRKILTLSFEGADIEVLDLSKIEKPLILEKGAFKRTLIKNIILPPTLVKIGEGAFADSGELVSVVMQGDSLKKIPTLAFESCSSLKKVTLPSSVLILGKDCFCECKNLNEINLPTRLISIGEGAFSECGLEEITLPKRIALIPSHCFQECKSLKKVNVSTNLSAVEEDAFEECISLEDIRVYNQEDDPEFDIFKDVDWDNWAFYRATEAIVDRFVKAGAINVEDQDD